MNDDQLMDLHGRRPQFLSFANFEMSADGLFVKRLPKPKEAGGGGKSWVSAPFEIIGEARDPAGRGWAKVLRWDDGDGREHIAKIAVAAIHGDPSVLAAMLAADGLVISRTRHRDLADYLAGASVGRRITTVSRTGWHRIGTHDVFVLPQETIGPRGAESVILDGAPAGPYETRGLLADWQRSVAEPAGEHALGVLALSASVAGSLLHLAGQEGGGINLWGPSSLGKSTLLKIAASVWGRGGSPGFVRAWRATSNGLEGAAASSSDTLLVLDELGVVEAREAATAIYGLANGSGKARASRNGDLREPKTWRLFTLSSGELPIEMKLNEDRGRRAMAGQLVRLLDIPVDRGMGFGAFDNGGPDADAAAVSKMLTAAALDNFGTAGPEFVRRLIGEGVGCDLIRTLATETARTFAPPRSDGQIDRAAQRLALVAVAGELGIELGIFPWRSGAPREAAHWAFDRWIDGRGGAESKEESQAIEQVRLVIEQHGASRFESLDGDGPRVLNRLGWTKGTGASREWWIPPVVWKAEICSGLDPRGVAKFLGRRGMLAQSADGWQIVKKIDGSPRRVFVVLATIFDGGD